MMALVQHVQEISASLTGFDLNLIKSQHELQLNKPDGLLPVYH